MPTRYGTARELERRRQHIQLYRKGILSICGLLRVLPSEITLDGKLPFLALPFKGRVEAIIREQVETLLSAPAEKPEKKTGPECHIHAGVPAICFCTECGKSICAADCTEYRREPTSHGRKEKRPYCKECFQKLSAETTSPLKPPTEPEQSVPVAAAAILKAEQHSPTEPQITPPTTEPASEAIQQAPVKPSGWIWAIVGIAALALISAGAWNFVHRQNEALKKATAEAKAEAVKAEKTKAETAHEREETAKKIDQLNQRLAEMQSQMTAQAAGAKDQQPTGTAEAAKPESPTPTEAPKASADNDDIPSAKQILEQSARAKKEAKVTPADGPQKPKRPPQETACVKSEPPPPPVEAKRNCPRENLSAQESIRRILDGAFNRSHHR